MWNWVGLIFVSCIAMVSSIGMDYSMTLKVIDTGTQILYPAWPVNLKCGFWQIEPNTVQKGGSNLAQARDKLGLCGSNLQVFYNNRSGKQVLRFEAITGFNQQNQFNYKADDKFKIDYKMKCGDTQLQNQIVKQGHPCYIEVYISYKDQNQNQNQNQNTKEENKKNQEL